jgi:hypothetical protein
VFGISGLAPKVLGVTGRVVRHSLVGLYGDRRGGVVGLSIVNQVLVRLWACCGQPV